MISSSFFVVAAAAGLRLVAATDSIPVATIVQRQDPVPNAGQTATPSITLQPRAVDPTCITSVYPASSSCNIGVHDDPGSGPTLITRAVPATCETFYGTTSFCKIGAHPQPTDISVTVTQTSDVPGGAAVTTVVTTAAQASISVPAAVQDGVVGYVLKETLRNDIVNVLNAACAKKLRTRDGEAIELVDLACTLPQSAADTVLPQIRTLISNALAFDPKAAAVLFDTGLTVEQMQTGLVSLIAIGVFGQAVGSAKLALNGEMAASMAKSILSGAGSGSETTTTSSSSGKPAPTAAEATPNFGTIQVDNEYTALLTKYLMGEMASATKICTYGAQPGLLKGGGSYCQCSGGIYPTSNSQYLSTISGTVTTLNEPCPYTEVPSTTTVDMGNTIVPTVPTPSVTEKPIPSSYCLPGAPAYGLQPVLDKAEVFCKDAASRGWAANADKTKYGTNEFNGKAPECDMDAFRDADILSVLRQKQYSYSDVKSDQSDRNLYLEIKFDEGLCGDQDKDVDFKKRGVDWCVGNFKSLLEKCKWTCYSTFRRTEPISC